MCAYTRQSLQSHSFHMATLDYQFGDLSMGISTLGERDPAVRYVDAMYHVDPALCNALYRPDLPEAIRLIESGVDVNKSSGYNKCTPLKIATSRGHVDIMKLLIDRGALVDKPTKVGLTPLFFAVQSGYVDAAELLIKHGANVSAVSEMGTMPLHTAVRGLTESGSDKKAIVTLLLDAGADVNAPERYGNTALMSAVQIPDVEVTKMLLVAGSDINAVDDHGATALHHAVYAENIYTVKILLLNGASITPKGVILTCHETTPLTAVDLAVCLAKTSNPTRIRASIALLLTDVYNRVLSRSS